ncbi:MAG TPA: NUDIX domain-containing protein [archaeon]|nr:NUDIX domain-containing protein [archaeon]
MEFLDVVDENDNVVGKAEKSEVYANALLHRIVHVFVFNNYGELALQLQGKNKKFCPLHWVTSAAGHAQSGETWKEAALRELKEEIGIEAELKELGKDIYQKPETNLRKIIGSFTANYDGNFYIDGHEVEAIKFFSMEEIRKMVKNGEKFHPEFLFLLEKYFS